MSNKPVSDIAFTEAVKQAQRQRGSRKIYENIERGEGWKDTVDESLASFLAQRVFFYFCTASRKGRPYIQYRGGPKGFVKVLDPKTLAFADCAGNRQYISREDFTQREKDIREHVKPLCREAEMGFVTNLLRVGCTASMVQVAVKSARLSRRAKASGVA
ncbi:Flavodoxin reductases (ferredoxin-NADPH reductases) family 1 [Olavius algarvensis associated proteobacterium Delta 3]|nr:Flavodoxin reductases (ferredoxin-NADPH reductases) family 1 [Olavius algarvensis associated proteobacterium Delta 3]CAB5166352.1 Flavodoxin reductases (ferredoxin-NADPH reductases) family 1 [Olavius algarvensis associated proteobacterium Delta 3]